MTVYELGNKLNQMYNTPNEGKVAMIHLFGIMYAREIINAQLTAVDVIRASGLNESYKTEIQKGMNLANYVEVKEQYRKKFQ